MRVFSFYCSEEWILLRPYPDQISLLCGTTRRFDSLLSRPTSSLSTSQFAVCSFLQYSFYPSHDTEGQAGKVTSKKKKATSVTEFEWSVSIYWRNKILCQFYKGETMAWNDMANTAAVIKCININKHKHMKLSDYTPMSLTCPIPTHTNTAPHEDLRLTLKQI